MITSQQPDRAVRSDLASSLRLYLDADAAYHWALVNCVSSGSDLEEIEGVAYTETWHILRTDKTNIEWEGEMVGHAPVEVVDDLDASEPEA